MSFNWDQMDITEKQYFAYTWEHYPQIQWNKVRTVNSTLEVLGILQEIAEIRANIELHVLSGLVVLPATPGPPDNPTSNPSVEESRDFLAPIQQTLPDESLRASKLADTDGVVQSDPRHAGGWWGLLTLDEVRTLATVNAPNSVLRMPPGTSSFMAAFELLTTTARGTGHAGARAAPQGMIDFVNGQRASAGSQRALLHMSLTLNGLLNSNADDLAHKYLLALRGHGTEEPGGRHTHHLADIVARSSDVDEQLAETIMRTNFDVSLTRFPQIFSATGTSATRWPGLVSRHLHRWKVSTGNHRNALQWLDTRVQSAAQRWSNTDAMADALVGTRDSELSVSESLTERITELQREVRSIRQSLTEARSQTTSQERIETLTNARTRISGWRRTFGTAMSGSTTVRGGSETTISGDGGFDILVADLTLDLTEKIIVGLDTQIGSTITAENETSGSTSETQSTTTQGRLGQQWSNTIEQATSFERQVGVELSRQRSHTRSITRVIQIRGIQQQIINIHTGIRQYME